MYEKLCELIEKYNRDAELAYNVYQVAKTKAEIAQEMIEDLKEETVEVTENVGGTL